jgi:hypothetical protein
MLTNSGKISEAVILIQVRNGFNQVIDPTWKCLEESRYQGCYLVGQFLNIRTTHLAFRFHETCGNLHAIVVKLKNRIITVQSVSTTKLVSRCK